MCAIIVLERNVMTKNFVEPEYEKKGLLVSSVEHTLITIDVVQMSITAEDYLRHIRKEKMYVSYQYVDDSKEIASALFKLMNIIVEKLVIVPKEINDIYNLLPQSKIDGMNRRDRRKTTETVGSK